MQYDCIIVGGGAVGATLALALAQLNYQILLVEKGKRAASLPQVEAANAKTLALSYASAFIYSQLGIWENLKEGVIPIQRVWVSVKGQYGSSELNCHDHHLPALGYVVGTEALEANLYSKLQHFSNVKICEEALLARCRGYPTHWEAEILTPATSQIVAGKLLVGADGAHSSVRDKLHISTSEKKYDHYAIMMNIQLENAPSFTAVERFLKEGAIALLPWQSHYATCVWTMREAEFQIVSNKNEADFLHACQEQLGTRYGRIKHIYKKTCLPLSMKIAAMQGGGRAVLMGNAAHSLHPIAAQGLNLSLKDIWQFYNQASLEQCDLGGDEFLEKYFKARKTAQAHIIFATDKIARFVSGGPFPCSLRAMGITLFDMFPPIKHAFTRFAAGLF